MIQEIDQPIPSEESEDAIRLRGIGHAVVEFEVVMHEGNALGIANRLREPSLDCAHRQILRRVRHKIPARRPFLHLALGEVGGRPRSARSHAFG